MSAAAHQWLPWQAQFIASILRGETLHAIRGGIGSGKTATLVYAAEAIATTRPGALVVLVTDTWPRLRDVLLPLCEAIFPTVGATYTASDRTWEMPGGSRVILRAYHRAATRSSGHNPLEGINAHALIGDEMQTMQPEVLDRMVNRARVPVADVAGRVCEPLVVTCGLPVVPCWWVERVQEAGGRVWLPKSADNLVHLGATWLERQRDILAPDEYQALVENRPRPPKGQVLDTFRANAPGEPGNIVDGWKRQPGHRVVIALDFGRRKPAVVALAHDPTLAAWVAFDELAPDECLTPDLIAAIHRKGWGAAECVCDPAGSARNAQTGRSDVDMLRAPAPDGLGIPVVFTTDPVKRDIRAGITRWRQAIHRGEWLITRELWDTGIRAPRNMRTLARSIQGYRYPEKGGDEPLKDGVFDHHCFVAGTMVATPDGDVPIESIKRGDLVMTRRGPRPVVACLLTADREVATLETTAGSITGTADHPVWCDGGWVRLDALRYSDTVSVCIRADSKKSSTRASRTEGTRSIQSAAPGPTSDPTDGAMAALSTCTAWSTKRRWASSPTDGSCTTSTATHSTTTRPTSNASPMRSTSGFMRQSGLVTQGTSSGGTLTWSESGPWPQSGTPQTRAGAGTRKTASARGRRASLRTDCASSAGGGTSPSTPATPASAGTRARRRRVSRAVWTMWTASARCAARRSASTGTDRPDVVLATVLGNYSAGRAPVYNLTVAGEHEYFANGILVSNCDASRYHVVRYLWHGAHPLDGRASVAALAPDGARPRAAGLIQQGGKAWGR